MVLSLKLCQFLEFPVLRQAFTFKPLFLFTIIVNYIYVSISGALVVLFLLAQGLRWFLFMFFFFYLLTCMIILNYVLTLYLKNILQK